MTLIIFSGYDVNEFFSWEAIQKGLVPDEIAVLRYIDAVGVSKYLSENPCQANKYPYTTLGTRWNNCKFTYLYPPQTLFVGGILFSCCLSVPASVRP